MNKVENLLKTCEEKIKWFNWNFLWYGFWDELEKIKDEVSKDINDLDGDEVRTFIDICDNRLDRINILLRDLVTSISVLAIIASILVGTSVQSVECFNFSRILQILIILSFIFFPLLLCLYGNYNFLRGPKVRIFAALIALILVGIEIVVVALSILWHQIIILIIPIIFFVLFLFLLIGRFRAQAHAWSAIKEGVLARHPEAKA